MEIRTELKQVLRRLRLSGILFTLIERVSYARGQKLSYEEFLELVLSDEIERRDQGMIERRMRQGSLDPDQTYNSSFAQIDQRGIFQTKNLLSKLNSSTSPMKTRLISS